MVDKMPSVENLVDPFTKTVTRKVFVCRRDNIGFRCVSRKLFVFHHLERKREP